MFHVEHFFTAFTGKSVTCKRTLSQQTILLDTPAPIQTCVHPYHIHLVFHLQAMLSIYHHIYHLLFRLVTPYILLPVAYPLNIFPKFNFFLSLLSQLPKN